MGHSNVINIAKTY